MVQPPGLTEKDWEDIRDIHLEASRYLDEVVAHQRSQWQVATVLSPYAQEQARRVERTSPPASTERPNLSPEEAYRVSRERLSAFEQRGVRIQNASIPAESPNQQQRWGDLQDRRWQ